MSYMIKKIQSDTIKSKFNKLAKNYEQKAFKESLGLKYLSSIETSFTQKYIKKGNTNKLLLDEGIGAGRNSRILLKKGYKVIGLDFSRNMLNQCKKAFMDILIKNS